LLQHNTLTDSACKIVFYSGYTAWYLHKTVFRDISVHNETVQSIGLVDWMQLDRMHLSIIFPMFCKIDDDVRPFGPRYYISTLLVYRRIFHAFVISSSRLATDLVRNMENRHVCIYIDTSDRIHLSIRPRSRRQETRLAQFGRYNFR